MRTLKLANRELKKIFLKPIMLVTFFAVIVALAITTFTFTPTQKSYTSVQLVGTNINMAYQNFLDDSHTESKSAYDKVLEKQKNWITNYYSKIKNQTEIEQFKSLVTQTQTSLNTLHYAVKDYQTDKNQTNSDNVKTCYAALYNNASNTSAFLQALDSNISFYLKIEDFDTLIDFFDGIAKNIPQAFSNPDLQYVEICNFLLDNFDFKQISPIIQGITVLPITEEDINTMLDEYYYKIYSTDPENQETKLGILFTQIKNFAAQKSESTAQEDFDTLNTLVSNYKSVAYMSATALQNNWMIKSAGTMDDINLKSCIGFTKYNSYLYKQELAKYSFLLQNDKYDVDYLSTFSFNQDSGNSTNAFDFTIYAMQIVSFVLIIVSVFIASGTVASELSNGTMKMLAIRPYSRTKIIIGKLLATLSFMCIMLFISLLIAFGVGYFSYGIQTTNVLIVFDATNVVVLNAFCVIGLYFLSCILNLIFYICLTMFFSVLLKSNVISVIFGMGTYALSLVFNALLYAKDWFRYLPFAHLDLYKYLGTSLNSGQFFGFSLANGINFDYSITYIAVTILVFIVSTVFIFRKRNIA